MGAKIYQNKKYIAFFLIPAFVFMLIFLYYPFIQNIINSFQHIKYMGTAADKWNAPFYKNYLEIFKDPKMLIALKYRNYDYSNNCWRSRTGYCSFIVSKQYKERCRIFQSSIFFPNCYFSNSPWLIV